MYIFGNNVFIGAGSIILPNVRIGSNVVVGAGSIVNRDIPNNCVYAGNPARFICTIDEYKQKALESIKEKPLLEGYNNIDTDKTTKEMVMNSVKEGARFVKCSNFKQFESQF